ncbi:MAG: hypothetical protein K6T91_06110 [Firmicutes bacterium]|nr:hypothetical protein [Bacillota bacterium]
MSAKTKRIGILLLVIMLIAGLAAGAYAASSKKEQVPKQKNPKQAIGKNWDTKGVIKPNGKPKPKKNLKGTADPAQDKAIIESRPRHSSKTSIFKPAQSTN